MSIHVEAHLPSELYKTTLRSPDGKEWIADEPADKGGKNLGPSPQELLASSLASCTSITLKMYLQHKAWLHGHIKVSVDLLPGSPVQFVSRIRIEGDFTVEQQNRLMHVAKACPVHKILSSDCQIHTEFT